MNPQPDINEDPEAIRSEIDTTRQRMDDTIDALGQRLKGRHLLDEVLHLFRTQQGNGNMTKFKEKLSDSTGSALHSVVDTIKAHPMPAALIGAGIGWMIYERSRSGSGESYEDDYYDYRGTALYNDDFESDIPPEYVPGETGVAPLYTEEGAAGGVYGAVGGEASSEEGSRSAAARERLRRQGERLREKGAAAKERLSQSTERFRARGGQAAHALQDRARSLGADAQERARRAYERGRQRVDQHPLESGFACLALGLIVGLALPASRRVRDAVGPTARDLSDRAREAAHDMVDRGKHVAQAATEAARQEAESQGLTPDALSEKASSVARKAKDAAKETAEQERTQGSSTGGGGTGNSPVGGTS